MVKNFKSVCGKNKEVMHFNGKDLIPQISNRKKELFNNNSSYVSREATRLQHTFIYLSLFDTKVWMLSRSVHRFSTSTHASKM